MKNYNEFLGESNIGDHVWQVVKDDTIDSWWEYKNDAIDRIIEILDLEGDNGLSGFEQDGDELTTQEITYLLEDESEEDFYTILSDLKDYSQCSCDIKLYNIDDPDEVEFLKDDETYSEEFD